MDDVAADPVYWQIGRWIREAREARGTTQDVLASRAQLTRASVSNIEAGRQRVTVHALLEWRRPSMWTRPRYCPTAQPTLPLTWRRWWLAGLNPGGG